MIRLINLTPHKINILTNAGICCIQPTRPTPRIKDVLVDDSKTIDTDRGEISIIDKILSDVIDLPPPAKDTMYVVSLLLAMSCPNRDDLLVVGSVVKDSDRRVLYTLSLAHIGGTDDTGNNHHQVRCVGSI